MSLILNYNKLFRPYMEDGHTPEATLKYLQKVAATNGITLDVMELAINEVFNQIAEGKEFSMTHCSCGCGIDKAATDLIHTIRDRMLEIDKGNSTLLVELMQQRYETVISDQMRRINMADKQYVKMNRPPLLKRLGKLFSGN